MLAVERTTMSGAIGAAEHDASESVGLQIIASVTC
jgi:hypothetical protein